MATAVRCVLVSTCGRCRFIWIDPCAAESIFGRWAFVYRMQFYDVPVGLVFLWSAFGISKRSVFLDHFCRVSEHDMNPPLFIALTLNVSRLFHLSKWYHWAL